MDSPRLDKLQRRVVNAAEAALAAQHYVSAIDVLGGIGWLDGGAVARWRQGQIDCLESVVRTKPARISQALRLLQDWAAARGLTASETEYVSRHPLRQPLRFSMSGASEIEKLYRTHWISGELPAQKRARLAEKASKAPDLVVIQPLNTEWKCHCGQTGGLLMMEAAGPACLRCLGLDDLDYLPAGDALLTRRVKAKSARWAVVVRFSRTRKRYERQGLLVEPQALAQVRAELGLSSG
jgi:hypothetical protein